MRICTVVLLLLLFRPVAYGKEFFVLQGVDKTHPDDLLTAPGVDGFTIRVSWRKLHEEGFDWLNAQIARGEALDVDMQLRVMGGAHAPSNLPGVSYFNYLSTNQDGTTEIERVPIPWDTAMHQHWQVLALELAARYGHDSRIKVVHIPSFGDSSELHMPDEVTQLAGYSSRGLAESWASMAAPLVAAFPQAIVSLNYATPSQAEIETEDSEWLVNEFAAMAGDRAGYQANDLSADVTLDRPKYETLVEQQELGRNIGFQMVSSSYSSRFGGDFLEAVATAFEAGGQWLEIYVADVHNIPPTGDYNFDGTVDAADYVVWRKMLGQVGVAIPADGNQNDQVDPADHSVWRTSFGDTSGAGSSGAAGSSSTNAAVPEPNGVALWLGSGILWALRRRRR